MEDTKDPSATTALDQNINPWSVTGEVAEDDTVKPINYNKLVEQFGTKLIDDALLARFERVTGHNNKLHRFLRRGIVFSHRDLEVILDRHERNEPFFIYTGRGPSSDVMHIGHMVPFELAKWLSDVFEVPVVVMLTDGEFQTWLAWRFAWAAGRLADEFYDDDLGQTRSTSLARATAQLRTMSILLGRMQRISSRSGLTLTGRLSSRIMGSWAASSITSRVLQKYA